MPTYTFSNGQDLTNRYSLDFPFTGYNFHLTLKADLALADAADGVLSVDHLATADDAAAGYVDLTIPAASLDGLTGRYFLDCRIVGPDGEPVANIPPAHPDVIVLVPSATRRGLA